MRLVLDTNAYSGLMRGQAGVVRRVRAAEHLYLPAPVVGELLYGFRGGDRFQRNREQLRRFLGTALVEFVPTGHAVCDHYSTILRQLRAKGRPIPTNDVWIAAHVLALDAILLSSDRHFEAVEDLHRIRP